MMIIRYLVLGCVLLAGGCSSQPATSDPLSDLRNPKLSVGAREKAIVAAWAQAQAGTLDRMTVREDLKNIAWSRHWTTTLRLAAIESLLSDTDEKGIADTRNMVRLMLPREPEPKVTELLSKTAAERGWHETTPALVRSLSQVRPGVPDLDRPEAVAIKKLNPTQSIEVIVYQVFVNPPEEGGAFGIVPAERVRSDAWDLLARLDRDGSMRVQLLDADTGKPGPAEDIRAGLRDLRIIPVTGEELRWLSSLRNDKTSAAWWSEATRAIAPLEPARIGKLQLRHMEPIVWCAKNRSEWLNATKQQLLEDLRTRLTDRQLHRRTATDSETRKNAPERLRDWENKLSWGDMLSILVVDDALKQPGLNVALFAQAEMDRDDRTAEYGGLIRSEEGAADKPGAFAAVMYPPRPGARRGDKEFVASSDMIAQGDRALAHYHFHVQDARNSEYAGPSAGDLIYAARSGRTCLVFTSISSTIMNVDVYTPDGAVLDLGEIAKP